MTDERARAIVEAVERQHKAFHSLNLIVRDGVAIVRFQWFDRPALTAVMEWFKGAGVRPMLVGRECLVSGDYGVIRFTEAA